mmetsp:Transcript_38687/g.98796  ORF Transcript_38687/g.98796 Transcript_38687/m.98796 type:complete len:227 (-) Transcript_38687:32-712(-)
MAAVAGVNDHAVAVPECIAGKPLEPFLVGFLEGPFRRDVQSFIAQHAPEFCVACVDGSYPLAWTERHGEYRQLFERQLRAVVQEEGFSSEDFREYCEELRETAALLGSHDLLPACGGVRVADFWEFLRALTASEDFGRFLAIMFEASAAALPRAGGDIDASAPEQPQQQQQQQREIEVAVPDGACPGQAMLVEFLGNQFELVVPDGCIPGTSFRAMVAVPSTQSHG